MASSARCVVASSKRWSSTEPAWRRFWVTASLVSSASRASGADASFISAKFSAKNLAEKSAGRAILGGMPRYRASVTTGRSPDDAFEYMASFQNVAEWDPGVVEAERVGSGQLGVGSRFRVVVSSAGRKLPLEYKVTQFEPPHLVLLSAETATLRSVDRITVEPTPDGATVNYDANLELLGLLRIFNPALALVFNRIGDRAAAGLRRELQG